MKMINIESVTKRIKGTEVLTNISVSFEPGKIYGIIGKNGSGKTMLIRLISGLIKPTTGNVEIHDASVGIVLENSSLYPEFTGLENLKFLANINKKISEEDIRRAIIDVGLDPDDKRKLRKYSLGMKQRIAIAQAIMEHPDILLLDEPTNAIDEAGVKQIRKIIMREAKRGAIVILASHNNEDIEMLCDEIFYMAEGKIKECSI